MQPRPTDGDNNNNTYCTHIPVGEAVRQVERVLVELRPDNERQGPKRLQARSRKLVLEVAGVRPRSEPPHTFLLRPLLEARQVT